MKGRLIIFSGIFNGCTLQMDDVSSPVVRFRVDQQIDEGTVSGYAQMNNDTKIFFRADEVDNEYDTQADDMIDDEDDLAETEAQIGFKSLFEAANGNHELLEGVAEFQDAYFSDETNEVAYLRTLGILSTILLARPEIHQDNDLLDDVKAILESALSSAIDEPWIVCSGIEAFSGNNQSHVRHLQDAKVSFDGIIFLPNFDLRSENGQPELVMDANSCIQPVVQAYGNNDSSDPVYIPLRFITKLEPEELFTKHTSYRCGVISAGEWTVEMERKYAGEKMTKSIQKMLRKWPPNKK